MIKVQRHACLAVSVLFFQTSIGCLSTNSPQLERCQTEKKQLLSRLVDEQKRGESLTTELRTANQRLADAEKQLARVVGGSGAGRLASVTELGNIVGGGSGGLVSGPTSGATIGAMGGATGGSTIGSPIGATSSGLRPLQLGAPRDSQFVSAMPNNSGAGVGSGTARGSAESAAGGSASNTAGSAGGSRPSTVDARGFDQLAPRNGRSESGWMPRSSGAATGASAAGSMGGATDGSSR
jgi:hypothetical protein